MKIHYETTSSGDTITVASYHDTDGTPMSSRQPGYISENNMKYLLASFRKNDRGRQSLLQNVKKIIFKIVE